MNKVVSAQLEGLPGQLLDATDATEVITWRADSDQLELSIDEALVHLAERQESADGCDLTLYSSDGDAPEVTQSKRVDIVMIEYHEAMQAIVAELRVHENTGRAEDRTKTTSNGDVDGALEDSFPASDPPAFNPGKA